MPPSVSVALPLPPGTVGERQDADVVLRPGPCRSASWPACMPSSHWPIRSIAALPSPNMPADCACEVCEIAGLERLERGKLAQALAGFDERRVLESAVLAGLRVGERSRAADPHDEIGPVEMHRPFLAAADDDRRDPGGLELLHRAEEIVPGLDRLGLHAGLREQLLVVEEGDLAHVRTARRTTLPSTLKASTAVGGRACLLQSRRCRR